MTQPDEEAVRAAHDQAASDPRAGADLLAAGLLDAALDPGFRTRQAGPPPLPLPEDEEAGKPAPHKPARQHTASRTAHHEQDEEGE
jgi:hypothetical protein